MGKEDGRTEVVGFEVTRIWKGPRYKTIYLKSTLPTDCNFPYWSFYRRFGDELLIYARTSVSSCAAEFSQLMRRKRIVTYGQRPQT